MWTDMSVSVAEIGRRLGISGGAVKQRAEVRGLPDRPRGRPFGRTYDHDRFVALYRAGLSMDAIARSEKCTQHTVLMALRRAGVKSRHRKDTATADIIPALMARDAARTAAEMIRCGLVDNPHAVRHLTRRAA